MNYSELYKSPIADAWVEERLRFTGLKYPCDTGTGGCGKVTQFRLYADGTPAPCCSQECRMIIEGWIEYLQKEEKPELAEEATPDPEVAVS